MRDVNLRTKLETNLNLKFKLILINQCHQSAIGHGGGVITATMELNINISLSKKQVKI